MGKENRMDYVKEINTK